jgi:SRSO17 transposase
VKVRDGLPGKDVWVYVRHLEDGSLKYSLTNAPAGATLDDISKPAHMRWSIEQCFKELKDYLGMDHCEARSWTSFHRYVLISAIAHLFLNQLRQKFSIKMEKPGHSPYIENPVPLRDYLEAAIQLRHEEPISDPDIKAMPDRP